jgi:hypothetical protein
MTLGETKKCSDRRKTSDLDDLQVRVFMAQPAPALRAEPPELRHSGRICSAVEALTDGDPPRNTTLRGHCHQNRHDG